MNRKECTSKPSSHLFDGFHYTRGELVHEEVVDQDGKRAMVDFMPWKNRLKIPSLPARAVIRVKTFIEDLKQNCLKYLFLLLGLIPGIEFTDDGMRQSVLVQNEQWREYLPTLENHCLTFLIHIVSIDYGSRFNWSETAAKLGLLEYGFQHFANVLSILRQLNYISHTPLLPSGIEIFTTDQTLEPIPDNPPSTSPLFQEKQDFDELARLKKICLSAMNVFARIDREDVSQDFIRQYLRCAGLEDYLGLIESFLPKTNLTLPEQEEILSELNEVALTREMARLNEEQLAVHTHSVLSHINVLAGPGSGKTHLLTLRCARLIYKEGVDPHEILVLAYNRAVAVELRLGKLLLRLGLGRITRRIPVYTFHGPARYCLRERLEGTSPSDWDGIMLSTFKRWQAKES